MEREWEGMRSQFPSTMLGACFFMFNISIFPVINPVKCQYLNGWKCDFSDVADIGGVESDGGMSTSSMTVLALTSSENDLVSPTCTNCTPVEEKLRKLEKQLLIKTRFLVELRAKYKRALRKIRTLSKQKAKFGGTVSKFLNFDQQRALTKTTTKGCKWNTSTVKTALQLHFACGPTGYSALLKLKYPLPSPRTLHRSIQDFKFDSGILDEVFNFLSIKVATLRAEERECCLTVDEMSIKPSVELDNRSGCFLGNVTLPGHSGTATHSLVFMLAGITTRWKQTVAYYLTGNSTDGTVFADIVIKIITLCHSIGLNVAAVTSDMGSSNRAMWRKLGIVCGNGRSLVNTFSHPCNPEYRVCVLADVPHLIKNMRNHIARGQTIRLPETVVRKFNLPSNDVSIEPLKRLVQFQTDKDLKPAPCLTEKALAPSHFDKMKVSYALNVFSHSAASALRLMVETENWEQEVLTTAWFLEIMNKWFDLMSSRHPVIAISKFDVDKYNNAIEFLRSMIDIFENLSIGKNGAWKPVQTGIILSTQSVIDLQHRYLNNDNFKFLLTSRLTQDCLENLFSCVRSKNAIPTPLQFKNILRVLTVSQYLKGADKGSYDVDEGYVLADFVNVPMQISHDNVSPGVVTSCAALTECSTSINLSQAELSCLYYLGGYVLSRIEKSDVSCTFCIKAVKTECLQDLDSNITKLYTLKQYTENSLTPCSQLTFDLLLASEIIFRQSQDTFLSTTANVSQCLIQVIESTTADMVFPACHAIKHKIVRRFVGVRLQFYAKKQRLLQALTLSHKSQHEMGSKSMQMRKSVSNIK
jgi:hypothetical protein